MNYKPDTETESYKGYDESLAKIENLTWLPWIGCDYPNARKKILIVGESNYYKTNDPNNIGSKPDYIKENILYQREVIHECPIRDQWSNLTLYNIYRVLANSYNIDNGISQTIWHNISFYNFVQRLMNYTDKERPNFRDFFLGWNVFMDVIKIIKPDFCIFVGVSASNTFEYAMDCLGVKHSNVEWLNGQGAYGRKMDLQINDRKLPIVAIKHAGSYFTWTFWNNFLNEYANEAMTYINSLIPNVVRNDSSTNLDTKLDTNPNTNSSIIDDKPKLPTYLKHKPIIACDYNKIEEYGDAPYISIGRAQYDNDNDASIKIWRSTGKQWSRMSEEIPIKRIPDVFLLLLTAINVTQKNLDDPNLSYLHESFISKGDINFIKQCISKDATHFKNSLSEIKKLLQSIDLEKL